MKISISSIKKIVKDLYSIEGTLSVLPGEIDFNYKLETNEGLSFVLKIAPSNCNIEYLEFQQNILQYLDQQSTQKELPKIFLNNEGKEISFFKDKNGDLRAVRLLSWVYGRVWSAVNPKTDYLRKSMGEKAGSLTKDLQNYEHHKAHRFFEWDIAGAEWTREYLYLFNKEQASLLIYFLDTFSSLKPLYNNLRKSIVHNDVNDNNCIVSKDLENPSIIAIIDFGDAIYTQTINDLAICCSYAIMHEIDPLIAALPIVQGYHSVFPLKEEELSLLYSCIAMRLIISVTKSALNKIIEPENEYLSISEKPAWELLQNWIAIDSDFAHFSFRTACNFNSHPNFLSFTDWTIQQKISLSELFISLKTEEVHLIDLSVSSTWIGQQHEFNDLDLFQFKLDQLQKKHPNTIISGGYLEPRSLYTSSEYDKIGNSGTESRSVHLGIDFWVPAATPVFSFLEGHVVMALNDQGEKAYGGMLVLRHQASGFQFYTLYGHLNVASVLSYTPGDYIKKGQELSRIGGSEENGNWVPHLHFQVMLSLLNFKNDFPGVCFPNQEKIWSGICPDPNLFFKQTILNTHFNSIKEKIQADREVYLGKGMSLQYKTPIHIVRGEGVYLIDNKGRKFIDTVNNVAHVGHEHHKVVKAGQLQMGLLNTNTRYLHEHITTLAKRLIGKLPSELVVIHFVNSGSEANELAIRMVKTVTKSEEIIVSEVGYHGNTNMCVDISSYKFDGKGGTGAPKNVHVFPLPDSFRGKYRGENTGSSYAKEVKSLISQIENSNQQVGAFIVEPIISCGGQIELPKGFLKRAYSLVKNAGGLCISDEVQTGLGRTGSNYWGFQLHDVVPDIVTIGKPLGNGHPIAAVACTVEVAEKFANGMEFFNTFGGNPVSSIISQTVLEVVEEENLQKNALIVGNFLKKELQILSKKYPIIGDIRGQGLFLGIELVDSNLIPLGLHASYLVNRMKDHGILMSTDGPQNNVLKIKPPLVFSIDNAKEVLFYLKKILDEDLMKTFKS